MKTLFAIITVLALLPGKTIHAQETVTLHDGTNTIQLAGGNSIEFNFKGHYFSNLIFHDAAGKDHPLHTSRGSVNGAAAPTCPNQDKVSYASYEKNIAAYFCMAKYTPNIVYTEFDMTVDMPGGTSGKAQNRRVEVKLVK